MASPAARKKKDNGEVGVVVLVLDGVVTSGGEVVDAGVGTESKVGAGEGGGADSELGGAAEPAEGSAFRLKSKVGDSFALKSLFWLMGTGCSVDGRTTTSDVVASACVAEVSPFGEFRNAGGTS